MSTSEIRFGISKQPDETCPLINETIGFAQAAMDAIPRNYYGLQESEYISIIKDFEYYLSYLIAGRKGGKLEEIREANQSIRQWGQEWKEKAIELETQLDEMEGKYLDAISKE